MAERPLETKLVTSLDAGHLRAGAPVFARVLYDWESSGCRLRAGSTVDGHVIAVQAHRQGTELPSIALLFNRADCNGEKATSFDLVLFSLIGALGTQQEGMVDTGGLFGSISAPADMKVLGSATGRGASPPPYDPRNDMSLRSAAAAKPQKLAPGQVLNLRNVALSVGTGPEGGSVLTATGRGLRVERESELVLLPRSLAVRTAPAHTESATTEAIAHAPAAVREPASPEAALAPAAPPMPDETEVCTGSCMVIGEKEEGSLSRAGASAHLALNGLGFLPHDNREFTALPYESALLYVDANHLLFTFDPHDLRRRAGDTLRPDTMHTMRALLVNTTTRQVERIVNWTVLGDGQNVWSAGDGHVLVRVGHDLRLYDKGLKLIAARTFPGTMAWVSASPGGKMFAVGMLQERHTAALHLQLAQALAREPEEGIRVELLDASLKTIFETEQRSVVGQPALSSSGEVRATAEHGLRWSIHETRVDHTEYQVANVLSGCTPTLDTAMTGYVFVIGCSASTQVNWYRMLRMDGRTVLKAKGSSQELDQAVSAAPAGDRFAVRVVRTRRSMTSDMAFHKSDLSGEQISVFDTQHGRRLVSIALTAVPLTVQSFALSPTGKQVAVLGSGEILFYDLPR